MLSAAPMPCPIDLYHGPASFSMSMPAACQRLISAICVPDRSPREMKGTLLVLIVCSAKTAFLPPLDAGGVALGSDNDKIVVHNGIALHAKPFRNKFLLGLLRMHEYYVGIAAARYVEGLAGALGNDFNVDAGLLLEQGQDKTEQPGILRRSRRGNHDRFPLRRSERDLRKDKRNPQPDRPAELWHEISPSGS